MIDENYNNKVFLPGSLIQYRNKPGYYLVLKVEKAEFRTRCYQLLTPKGNIIKILYGWTDFFITEITDLS